MYQTINIIEDVQPDIVVIVGADHVYRMDFEQMVNQHIESGAEFTVAGIRQPIEQSSQFGVIEVDPEHPNMIKSFQEKPKETTGLPDNPNEILASMGNYVANTDALFNALSIDSKAENTKHDMGGDIAPFFAERNEAGVYDFSRNEIPGPPPRIMPTGATWAQSGSSTMRIWISSPTSPNSTFTIWNGRFIRVRAIFRRPSSCMRPATASDTPPIPSSPLASSYRVARFTIQ